MAVTKTTNFNGEASKEIYLEVIRESDIIKDNLFNSIVVSADQYTMRKTKTSGGFQKYSCDFVTDSDILLSESSVLLTKLEFTSEFCVEDLKRWGAESLSPGTPGAMPLNYDEITAIVDDMYQRFPHEFARNVFLGNTTNDNEFNGILTGLTPVELPMITEEDYANAIEKAIDLTDKNILNSKDFVLLVSSNVAMKYRKSLNLRGFSQDLHKYDKFDIIESTDLPDDTIMTYNKKNINILVDVLDSHSRLKIIDLRETTGDDKIRLIAKFKAATLVVEPADIVYITKE